MHYFSFSFHSLSQSNPVPSTLSVDYYLDEPDFDDHGPLEAYHNDINDLQLQQLNTWLLQVRVPFRDKDVYKSKFQRFNETRKFLFFSFFSPLNSVFF